MIRRTHLALIALAAPFSLGYQHAASQERIPGAPSKQIPPSNVSLEGNSPASDLVDASVEKTLHDAAGDVTPSQIPLQELAWIVGDWIDDDEKANIESSVRWSKNGAFLIHSFRVSNLAVDSLSGMQIVAWDPAQKHIRFWTYDSHGGFGEEITWSRVGDRWSLRKRFTLPDGGRASAVQEMTWVSDDAFRWKSVNRVIDGVLQPDIDEVTVVRKSEDAAPQRLASPGSKGFEHTRRREQAVKTTHAIIVFASSALFVALFSTYAADAQGLPAPEYAYAGARSAGYRAPGAATNLNASPSMTRPGGRAPGNLSPGSGGFARPNAPPGGIQRPNIGAPGGIERPNAGQPGGIQRPNIGAPGGIERPNAGQPGGIQRPNIGAPGGIERPNAGQPGGIQRPNIGAPGGIERPNAGQPGGICAARTLAHPAASNDPTPDNPVGFSARTLAHPAASNDPTPEVSPAFSDRMPARPAGYSARTPARRALHRATPFTISLAPAPEAHPRPIGCLERLSVRVPVLVWPAQFSVRREADRVSHPTRRQDRGSRAAHVLEPARAQTSMSAAGAIRSTTSRSAGAIPPM